MTSIKIEPRTKIGYANTFKKTRSLCWRKMNWANKQIRHVCCTQRTTRRENNAIELCWWDAAHISRRQSRHDVLQMCERYGARDSHWQLIFILIVRSGGGQRVSVHCVPQSNCVSYFHLSFSAFVDSSIRNMPSAFVSWNKQIFHSKNFRQIVDWPCAWKNDDSHNGCNWTKAKKKAREREREKNEKT